MFRQWVGEKGASGVDGWDTGDEEALVDGYRAVGGKRPGASWIMDTCGTGGGCGTGRHLGNGGGDRLCSLGLPLGEEAGGTGAGLAANLWGGPAEKPLLPTTQGRRSEVIMGVRTC